MTDVHNSQTRSYNMSQIKGKDTKPEILVRKSLFSNGFRYRLYDKKLPGKPDIVLPKFKTVILIHGCFWHGHKNCRYFVTPKTRTEWWLAKINDTKHRDNVNKLRLVKMGWNVITVWECEIKTNSQKKLIKIIDLIKSFVDICPNIIF
jgi:DNA mismatch endonuclease, patch repair protein